MTECVTTRWRALTIRRLARLIAVFGAAAFFIAHEPPAVAQGRIVAPGDAVVTGCSSVSSQRSVTSPLSVGLGPATDVHIDLQGPAARVIDLDNVGLPGQRGSPGKPFSVTAEQ